MQLMIRRAEVSDAAGIALVQVDSWRATYAGIVPDTFLAAMDVASRAESWKTRLAAESAATFVAKDESGTFGFISGGQLREAVGDYDAELYALYLLPGRWRQGVGRTLTQTLSRTLHAQGLRSLLVWVLEQNPAVGFYRHLGATQVARKSISIGGVDLPEIALGWPALNLLISGSR